MIGYYNRSVIVTYLALLLSVFGMRFSILGNAKMALICLMVCGLCDMIDGPIARRCKRTEDEKAFGIQIDSLCDLVCFGAQPAVFCLAVDSLSWVCCAAAAFFVLAGVIRLGYFNVQEINRVKVENGKRKKYDGLPITMSSMTIPLVAALDGVINGSARGYYWIAALITGVLFITPVRVRKLCGAGMAVCALIGAAIFAAVIIWGDKV